MDSRHPFFETTPSTQLGPPDGRLRQAVRSSNPSAQQRVAPLFALAAHSLRAGRPADAIAPLRDAALMQPFDPNIQHDLGLACLEVGRVSDAVVAFQQAVAIDP